MKGRPFRERMGFALAGLKAGWVREASFRAQARVAVLAVLTLVILRPAPVWWAIMALVVAAILALELLNSGIEAVIDLLHPGIHPEIKAAKDMIAGAVLVMSTAAVVIGIALAVERLPILIEELRQ